MGIPYPRHNPEGFPEFSSESEADKKNKSREALLTTVFNARGYHDETGLDIAECRLKVLRDIQAIEFRRGILPNGVREYGLRVTEVTNGDSSWAVRFNSTSVHVDTIDGEPPFVREVAELNDDQKQDELQAIVLEYATAMLTSSRKA